MYECFQSIIGNMYIEMNQKYAIHKFTGRQTLK